ncbi:MAG: hypothetical protein ACW981_12105 [Candidatus Hodarchaeales archaeon]|jgi:hypothetical protein
MKISEIIVLILGGLGSLILIISLSSIDSGNIRGLGSLVMLIPHLIVLMVALPFLLYSFIGSKIISKNFAILLALDSILNSILIFLVGWGLSGQGDFIIPAILELIPILFIYGNKEKIQKNAIGV